MRADHTLEKEMKSYWKKFWFDVLTRQVFINITPKINDVA